MSSKDFIRNDFLAGIFNRGASLYGNIGPEYFTYFGEKLVEKIEIFTGARVLDVACGRGASLFPASLKLGKTGFAAGVDFSENMIYETMKSIVEHEYKNVFVMQMDAEELLFQDNSFDFVLCGAAIQMFSRYDIALKEMFRVLKPGGKIGISSWKKKDKPPIIANVMNKYLLKLSAENKNIISRTIPQADFGSADSLEYMLIQAGFHSISIYEESNKFYYKDAETWWQEQWSNGGRLSLEMVETMGIDTLNSYKQEVFYEFEKVKDNNGIPYDAVALLSYAIK